MKNSEKKTTTLICLIFFITIMILPIILGILSGVGTYFYIPVYEKDLVISICLSILMILTTHFGVVAIYHSFWPDLLNPDLLKPELLKGG